MKKRQNRWIAILVALAGTGVCLVALGGFLFTVLQNNLPWYPDQSVRDHYLAVGESYAQGFTVGFFLCFFLIMIAVSVAAILEQRRGVAPARPRPAFPPSVHGGAQSVAVASARGRPRN